MLVILEAILEHSTRHEKKNSSRKQHCDFTKRSDSSYHCISKHHRNLSFRTWILILLSACTCCYEGESVLGCTARAPSQEFALHLHRGSAAIRQDPFMFFVIGRSSSTLSLQSSLSLSSSSSPSEHVRRFCYIARATEEGCD